MAGADGNPAVRTIAEQELAGEVELGVANSDRYPLVHASDFAEQGVGNGSALHGDMHAPRRWSPA